MKRYFFFFVLFLLFNSFAWGQTIIRDATLGNAHIPEVFPRIMCIGDSITVGVGDGNSFSYRDHLQGYLNITATDYRFVGIVNNPATSGQYQTAHSGVGGQKTYEVEARIGGELDTYFDRSIPASKVLLHIGTNDVSNNNTTSDIVDNVKDIIDIIDAHDESIEVYVALIIPRDDSENSDNDAYNAALNTMLFSYQGNKTNLYIVDMNTAFTNNATWNTSLMSDPRHPNNAGYQVMAQEWADAINAS